MLKEYTEYINVKTLACSSLHIGHIFNVKMMLNGCQNKQKLSIRKGTTYNVVSTYI